jgi:methylase of polypeptide subunit release factors
MSRPGAIEENWRRAGYGENSIRGRIATWFTEVIKAEGRPFGKCDADFKLDVLGRQLYADLLLWKKGRERKEAACIIELKIPAGWTPLDPELIDNALDKASKSDYQADYFATSNINEWVLWSTFERKTPLERRKAVFKVASITRPAEIDKPEFEAAIKGFASKFLTLLEKLAVGTEVLPEFRIDEFFIVLLQSVVNGHSDSLAIHLEETWKRQPAFRKALTGWFVSQGWTAPTEFADFERVARQYLYLLLNKVLFYSTLTKVHPGDLKPLSIDASTAIQFRRALQAYFDTAKDVTHDYETIFASNFLETIPLPDEIVPRLSSQLNDVRQYDFSKLGFRDIGRIFDALIPPTERHKLGQYYTRDDVVDLINGFCIRSPNATVADFGCGAGTFLVRAYARLRLADPKKSHSEAIRQIFGVDISKFAALLSAVNLAIRELEYVDNHPQVVCRDFFETFPEEPMALMGRSHAVHSLSDKDFTIEIPKLDAVVGNPPYTRREELEDYIEDYREVLDAAINRDWPDDLEVRGKASIFAWFYLHGLRFLKKSGRLGFVTPDSWLDVEYGRYLQDAFLRKTRILAVIKSSVERWFPDAAVNTAITVLERCDQEDARNANTVRFVMLKVPLSNLLPPNTSEAGRTEAVEELLNKIAAKSDTYEDENLRVYPVTQSHLLGIGTDRRSKRYVGIAWGKYLRISKSLDLILKRLDRRLVPLEEIASVELGYTTGFNDFFYLEKDDLDKWKIEPKYLVPILKSPKEVTALVVPGSATKKRLFKVEGSKTSLKGTNALKYIEWGESLGIPRRPYFRGKPGDWFTVPARDPPAIVHPNLFGERHLIGLNSHRLEIDKKLIGISPRSRVRSSALCAYLNSTFAVLMREVNGRSGLGYGALDVSTRDLEVMPVIDLRSLGEDVLEKLDDWVRTNSRTDFRSIFEELGARSPGEFNPHRVARHRLDLDEIVFDALGLTPNERKVVYEETLSLIHDRFQRAESVETRKKSKRNEERRLAESIVESLDFDIEDLGNFPDDYVEDRTVDVREVPISDDAHIGKDLFAGYFVEIGGEPVPCSSREEAEYIRYAALNGHRRVKVPRDATQLASVVRAYRKKCDPLLKAIAAKAGESIPDLRLRDEVVRIARQMVLRPNLEARLSAEATTAASEAPED